MKFEIGKHIRKRRENLRLTIAELAEKSQLSVTMISEVERGKKMPTVKNAYQIALALGCTLSDLIVGDAEEKVQIIRKEDRNELVDKESGIVRGILSNVLLARGIELVSFLIPPGQSTGLFPQNRLGVQEHITVISGQFNCKIKGQDNLLKEGDSITFDAAEVEFENFSDEDCHLILLISSK